MNKHETLGQLCAKRYELTCQRLYDSQFDPIKHKRSVFDSKYIVSHSDNVESFVNDVVLNNETIWNYFDTGDEKWYERTSLEKEYFRSFPDFIEIVKRLPPMYEYSEHVNAMIACCHDMGLLDRRHDWKSDWGIDPKKTYPYYEGLTGSEIFSRLVETLRLDWKRNKRQAKVNARAKENKFRYEKYCRYIDALFKKWSVLVVLRFDLGYKDRDTYNIDINDMQIDLFNMFVNTRNNPLFAFIRGHIVKLEYGVGRGIHCHVVLFLDGSKRNKSSHVYFAQEMGKYWEDVVTKGRGDYWNVNANADHYDELGRGAIGPINCNDADKIKNLKKYVVGYLCKGTQYFRPKGGPKLRLFRKGDFPEIRENGPGRPRKASENNAGDPFIPD